MRIGQVELKSPVILAPMAGVTDRPFRLLCKEKGCAMAVSEMISAKGLFFENAHTRAMLEVDPRELPLAVQLFGSDPDILAEMAKKMEDYPFVAIDINMGCPAPKIVKNGEGSALLKNPELVGRIVEKVAKAARIPVTVKIRKGFDAGHVNAVEIARIIEANGGAAVTVHGRTREQYYGGAADWDVIRRVKQAVGIPVIGNGDVVSPETARDMLAQTGCDAVMIGRAALGNPWIFEQVAYFLKTGEHLSKPTAAQKMETALRHCEMMMEMRGSRLGLFEMRKHLSWYTKGTPGGAEARAKINRAESFAEIQKILAESLFNVSPSCLF